MLEDKLRELLTVICGGVGQPPTPPDLLIAEEQAGKFAGFTRFALPRAALKTPAEYASRFDELMNLNYAWLNLNYCGVLEGHGLVLVTFPQQASGRKGGEGVPTSLNFSGPMKLVRDAGWDASAYVILSP